MKHKAKKSAADKRRSHQTKCAETENPASAGASSSAPVTTESPITTANKDVSCARQGPSETEMNVTPTTSKRGGGGALFEWEDGLLVTAMSDGQPVLIDEISLATDSVLERLNAVLEPDRSLTLTESIGGERVVVAKDGFQLMATMNPGGDYGKRELSRALRNRFTEIWCDSSYSREDLLSIVKQHLSEPLSLFRSHKTLSIADMLVDFVLWFAEEFANRLRCAFTIRDILAWVYFMNETRSKPTSEVCIELAYVHGACLVLLDALDINLVQSSISVCSSDELRQSAIDYLIGQLCAKEDTAKSSMLIGSLHPATQSLIVDRNRHLFGMHPFTIDMDSITNAGCKSSQTVGDFSFNASAACCVNALRVLRALQIRKPILLEGAPGVGKSSLIVAMAKAAGHELTRLNLSDQTDLNDLFGSDVPVTSSCGQQSFAWADGPLLTAMKSGHWVLLDEMNLASQSVLEGLNACLDHRGRVYIPELAKSFQVHPTGSRFFAAQNPSGAGGQRRTLPKSFMNRFSMVHMRAMHMSDELAILSAQQQPVPHDQLQFMVSFNQTVIESVCAGRRFGLSGGPWEFNLRDLLRWTQLMRYLEIKDAAQLIDVMYAARFRTQNDREQLFALAESIGASKSALYGTGPNLFINDRLLCVGRAQLHRHCHDEAVLIEEVDVDMEEHTELQPSLHLLRGNMRVLEQVMLCVQMNWLCLLVGVGGSGKSSLVQSLAQVTGHTLFTLHLTADTDAMELLGSYEQTSMASVELNELKSELGVLCAELGVAEMDVECAQLISRLQECTDTLQFKHDLHALHSLLKAFDDSALQAGLQSLSDRVQCLITQGHNGQLIRFEWQDGLFVRAFTQGHWLLVNDVNCCNAAVLDRLNSALEKDGSLTVPERACAAKNASAHFTPHPNFRIFFTMDARNGQLSRAMRNRAVEICMLDGDDGCRLSDAHRALIHTSDTHDVLCSAVSGTAPLLTELMAHTQTALGSGHLKQFATHVRLSRHALFECTLRLGCVFGCDDQTKDVDVDEDLIQRRVLGELKMLRVINEDTELLAIKHSPLLLPPSLCSKQLGAKSFRDHQIHVWKSVMDRHMGADQEHSSVTVAVHVALGMLLTGTSLFWKHTTANAKKMLLASGAVASDCTEPIALSDMRTAIDKVQVECFQKYPAQFAVCADRSMPWNASFYGGQCDLSRESLKLVLVLRVLMSLDQSALSTDSNPTNRRSALDMAKAVQQNRMGAEQLLSECITQLPALVSQLHSLVHCKLDKWLNMESSKDQIQQLMCGVYDLWVFLTVIGCDLSTVVPAANQCAATQRILLQMAFTQMHKRWAHLSLIRSERALHRALTVCADEWVTNASCIRDYQHLMGVLAPSLSRPFQTRQHYERTLCLVQCYSKLVRKWECVSAAGSVQQWQTNTQCLHKLMLLAQEVMMGAHGNGDACSVGADGHMKELSTLVDALRVDNEQVNDCTAYETTVLVPAWRRLAEVSHFALITGQMDSFSCGQSQSTPSLSLSLLMGNVSRTLNGGEQTADWSGLLSLISWLNEPMTMCAPDAAWIVNGDSRMQITRGLQSEVPVWCLLLSESGVSDAANMTDCNGSVHGSTPIVSLDQHQHLCAVLGAHLWTVLLADKEQHIIIRKRLSDQMRRLVTEWVGVSENETVTAQLRSVLDSMNNCPDVGTSALWFGSLLLRAACPPANAIDPVLKHTVKNRLLQMKLELLEASIYSLDEYQVGMNGCEIVNGTEHTDLYIAAMHKGRHTISDKLTALESKQMNGYRPNDLEWVVANVEDTANCFGPDTRWSHIMTSRERRSIALTKVHVAGRSPKQSNQETASLRKYTSVLADMIAFSAMSNEHISAVRSLDTAPTHTVQRLATVHGWLRSVKQHVHNMRTHALAYGDLLDPYILALELVRYGMSSESMRLYKQIRNTEIQPVSETNALDLLQASSEASPQLQLRIAQNVIESGGQLPKALIDWMLNVWQQLVTHREEEEKQYEYRQSKKHTTVELDEGEVEDTEDEQLMARWLPDHSLADTDADEDQALPDQSTMSANRSMIGRAQFADWLIKLAHGPDEEPKNDSSAGIRYLVQMHAVHCLSGPELDVHLLAGHLRATNRANAKLQSDTDMSIDVYNQPPPQTELKRMVATISALRTNVRLLIADWPEQTSLKDCDVLIGSLLALSASTPWTRLSAHLERLLVSCDQWEGVASRAVSLRAWLQPISELLLDWRRAQVQHWHNLLALVDTDLRREVLLAAKPILEVVSSQHDLPAAATVLAMCQQWMNTATIGDYVARVYCLQLVIRVLQRTSEAEGHALSQQIASIQRYYQLYTTVLQARRTKVTAAVTKELKDFVKVVKFQDLNTWSIKLSAQKAHGQLLRVIKKYKLALSESCTCVYEQPLEWSGLEHDPSTAPSVPCLQPQSSVALSVRMCSLIQQQLTLYLPHVTDCVLELAQVTQTVLKQLTEPVHYKGSEEDQRKQHGRTMVSRQRALTELLRVVKECGWTYRRGLKLNVDSLDTRLMTETDNTQLALLTAHRLRMHRAANTIGVAGKEAPAGVGLSTVQMGRGLVDLISHQLSEWTITVHNVQGTALPLAQLNQCWGTMVMDGTSGHALTQHVLQTSVSRMCDSVNSARQSLNKQVNMWRCVPADNLLNNELSQSQLLQSDRTPEICRLNSESAQMIEALGKLTECQKLMDRLYVEHLKAEQDKAVANQYRWISRAQCTALCASVSEGINKTAPVLKSLVSMTRAESADCPQQTPFNEHLLAAIQSLSDCECIIDDLTNERTAKESAASQSAISIDGHVDESIKQMQLSVQAINQLLSIESDNQQSICGDSKSVEVEVEVVQVVNAMQQAVRVLHALDVDKLVASQRAVYSHLLVCGERSEESRVRLQQLSTLSEHMAVLCNSLVQNAQQACDMVGAFGQRLSQLFAHLLVEGYAPPVPQISDENEQDGKEGERKFEDMQNAGMGAGEGVKDVTDEIEDQSQIEDTHHKDDVNKEQEEEPAPTEDKDDGNKPIDLDDDFSAPLEDLQLDDEHSDSESDGEQDKDKEPDTDMQMGENEQPHDKQIDPGLWDEDKEEDAPQNELDQDNDAATKQKEEEELTAKDTDALEDLPASDQVLPEQDTTETDADQEGEEEDVQDEHLENVDLNEIQPEQMDEEQPTENLDQTPIDVDDLDSRREQEEEKDEPGKEEEEAVEEDNTEMGEDQKDSETQAQEDADQQTMMSDTNQGTMNRQNTQALDNQLDIDIDAAEHKLDQENESAEQEQDADRDQSQGLQQHEQGDASSSARRHRASRPEDAANQKQAPPSKRQRMTESAGGKEERSLGDQAAPKDDQTERVDDEDVVEDTEQMDDQSVDTSKTWKHQPDLRGDSAQMNVTDAASLEEARQQAALQIGREDADKETGDADNEELIDLVSEPDDDDDITEITPTTDSKKSKQSVHDDRVVAAADKQENIREEHADPAHSSGMQDADRPTQSTIHTALDFYTHAQQEMQRQSPINFDAEQAGESSLLDEEEARRIWLQCTARTEPLAGELTENLRLILEPTKASKLQGDYRTGKRLNMRRLISYVASGFRKNKIWLRRTKKAQRDYQVLIAVDDSKSMHDNKTRTLAYESLSLMESALRRLEVGQLGVCSFGAETRLLHAMDTPISDAQAPELIRQLTFEQHRTNIVKLLSFSTQYFEQLGSVSSSQGLPHKLLLIVSDGRGIFLDGQHNVKMAVQNALSAGVFIVFVIVDSPTHAHSIVDVKMPEFPADGGAPTIKSYMSAFPFPFYVILREINALPAVLGDALRQWFQLVTDAE